MLFVGWVWVCEGGREGLGTYGEGEEGETEKDAGVADEGEDIHLFNGWWWGGGGPSDGLMMSLGALSGGE